MMERIPLEPYYINIREDENRYFKSKNVGLWGKGVNNIDKNTP